MNVCLLEVKYSNDNHIKVNKFFQDILQRPLAEFHDPHWSPNNKIRNRYLEDSKRAQISNMSGTCEANPAIV